MAKASQMFLKRSRAQNAKAWLIIREVKFLVQSAMHKDYQKKVAELGHDDDPEFYSKLVAEYLILDWKGLDNEDNTEMECTLENKIKLLLEYTEIGSRVLTFASAPFNFIECNNIEEELGN